LRPKANDRPSRTDGHVDGEETTVMTRWSPSQLAAGVLVLALGGCQEPTEIVPAAPPGIAYTRVPPPEKDEPQARGETAMQTPADASKKTAMAGTTSPPTAIGETKTSVSGVKYETLKAGDGPEAKPGDTVSVHYTGTLENGTKFDSSRDRGQPIDFAIGKGDVIAGWDEGIPGMKVGERRKLTIPSELGYGSQGKSPSIPGGATLIFDVELVGIK
jgi:FKBP-type peptidyl-prolyl cis-trans isomerase